MPLVTVTSVAPIVTFVNSVLKVTTGSIPTPNTSLPNNPVIASAPTYGPFASTSVQNGATAVDPALEYMYANFIYQIGYLYRI